MSTQDATLPFGQHTSQPEAAQDQQPNNGKSNTAAAAVATGAAAAAVGAAGYYAYTQMAGDEEVIDAIVVDDEEEVDTEIVDSDDPALSLNMKVGIDTGNTTGSTTGNTTGTHTVTNPGTGTRQPIQGTDPGTGTVTDPGTGTTTDPGTGTTTDPGTGTVTNPGTGGTTDPGTGGTTVQAPPAPVDPVVDPQIDVHENPDDIADALIAVDEVDPDDIDGAAPFTFTDVDTVYDIYGNATTQAHYYADDGSTGVMIDLDGDGVFDEFTDDASGTTYAVNDDTFFTVGDAELDADTGYIAYNEDQDTMIDDDPMDDIIDSGDFA